MKVLFYNRFGDFMFFFSIYMLANLLKTDNFMTLSADYLAVAALKLDLVSSLFIKNFLIFSFFIVILSKSAQFGFHIWLLEAMEAPLPASSLIHSATLVCAGVVLFFKVNIFAFFSPFFIWLLVTWAAATSLMLSTSALFNYDIKKILAYSTGSHISIMLVASAGCSLNLAFNYLLIHASSKVFIFLLFGYIIDINGSVRDIRKMGGFYFNNLVTNFVFLAVFSLSSLPFFALGFLKDTFMVILFKNSFSWDLVYFLVGLSSLANYFYMFRLFFKIFFGDRLSFSYTYYRNLFFSGNHFYYESKTAGGARSNSNFFVFFSLFILFNLLTFIIFFEFSSYLLLKVDLFNISAKIMTSTNYSNLNSVFKFLHYSNSYLLILAIFFYTAARRYL
jgi:NADH:ubiquinone oxidoreductase subunit 5 (subunit L)/multisubunit Na+/H+ antiporter MnhA subunit